MEKERITREHVKNHWRYNWWKYVLMTALVVMTCELIFTMTEYRPPADRQLIVYFCNGGANTDAMQEDFWPLVKERYPEQELLTVQNVNLAMDDMYAQMQFATYVASRQGDVVILPADEMLNILGGEGEDFSFVDLKPYLESGVIDAGAIDCSPYEFVKADGTVGVYGIPTDSLEGLARYGARGNGGVMSIMFYSENADCAAGLAGILLDQLKN